MTRALRAGLRVRSPEAAFTLGDRTFPAGSMIISRPEDDPRFDQTMADIAEAAGAEIIGVDSTWVTDGPNFASDRSPIIPPVRIALAWDEPTDSSSAGAIRYILEQRYGYPVSIIRTENLGRADLSRYQVIILPDAWGSYDAALAGPLRAWVQRGGNLVGIGSGADLMMAGDSPMLATAREPLLSEDGNHVPAPDAEPRIIQGADGYAEAIRPAEQTPDSVLGVLAQVEVDRQHWLSAGLPDRLTVLVNGAAIYEPLRLDEGTNVLRYVSADDLPVAGHLWAENRAQLAFKPYVMSTSLGRGQVIAFTQDPTFRGFLHGQDVLFLNAIFRGAAHSSPVR